MVFLQYETVNQHQDHQDPTKRPSIAVSNASGISDTDRNLEGHHSDSIPSSNEGKAYDADESVGRELGHRGLFSWMFICFSFIMGVFPLLLIALACIAIYLDKRPVSDMGKKVQKVITVSPTIFPIVFAAITGKFLRIIAVYLAQRGTRLGTLERLMGSQSLFGAIERQFALKSKSILGILIILLWASSPLGGQSALRLLSEGPHTISSNTTIRYEPIEAGAYAYGTGANAFIGVSDATSEFPMFASLFTAAVRAYPFGVNSTMDMYGNVRIPRLPSTSNSSEDWQTIEHGDNLTVPYTSMLGIPVVGVPSTGEATFNMTSRYFSVDCTTLTDFAVDPDVAEAQQKNDTSPYWNWETFNNTLSEGATFQLQNAVAYGGLNTTSPLSFNLSSMTSDTTDSGAFAACSLGVTDVGSSVHCQDSSCQVNAMRNLTSSTDIEHPNIEFSLTANLFMMFPMVTVFSIAHGSAFGSSIAEFFLRDPLTPYEIFTFVQLNDTPIADFSNNLEMALNTLWQSAYWPQFITGNLTTNLTYYDHIVSSLSEDPTNGIPDSVPKLTFNTTTAQVVQTDGKQYKCNRVFAGLLIAVSFVLVIEVVITIVVKHVTLAPDILGFVSTSTRGNPYFQGQERCASYYDGMEAARAMKDVKVMIGHVPGPGDGVAGNRNSFIAFAPKEVAKPLTRGTFYQ